MDYSIAFLLLSVTILGSFAEGRADVSKEAASQVLLDSMLKNYDKRVPPPGIGGIDTPVHVKTSMYILDIEKISDYHQTFRAQFYFRQSWNDSRLRYDGQNSPVEMIYVREADRLWTPDLFFSQESEGRLHDVLVPNVFMRLQPSGSILYSLRVSATFQCKMDLRKFPFDTQKCKIAAESYGYTTKMIDLAWIDDHSIGYSKEISLREYALSDVTQGVEVADINGMVYRCLNVIFTIERKTDFYTLRLFVPFFLLTALSWLTFWIPAKHRTLRLTLLLTILYIMLQIGSEVNLHHVTATDYTKGSDVWIGVCEALVFACLLEFVLVSLLTSGEKETSADGPELNGIDVESKDKETEGNSDSLQSSAKFVARSLCRHKQWSQRADFISRIAFPVLFLFFNVIYWSVYCRKE